MTTKSKAFGDFRTLTTPEAVLRHALEYFETTEEPSLDTKGRCVNRGPDGSCCVFGSAIPDDHPAAQVDVLLSVGIWWEKHDPESIPDGILSVWLDMQGVHDYVREWSPIGGLSTRGVTCLEGYWNHHLPDVPFPGYNYRGAR